MAATARSAFSGDGPSANVLPIMIVAIPHVAMAQAGSRSSASRNALSPAVNAKEWRSATPRSKLSCASAEQEFAKATVPSFSLAGPATVRGGAACGQRAERDKRTSINERKRAPRIASLRWPLVDISKSRVCRLPGAAVRPLAHRRHRRNQGIGDLLSVGIAGESPDKSPVRIDQIDKRRVIIDVTAIVRITPLVEHLETLGGHAICAGMPVRPMMRGSNDLTYSLESQACRASDRR